MLPDSMLECNLRRRVASYPGQRRGTSSSNTPSCVILQKPELRVKGYEPVELKRRCVFTSGVCCIVLSAYTVLLY